MLLDGGILVPIVDVKLTGPVDCFGTTRTALIPRRVVGVELGLFLGELVVFHTVGTTERSLALVQILVAVAAAGTPTGGLTIHRETAFLSLVTKPVTLEALRNRITLSQFDTTPTVEKSVIITDDSLVCRRCCLDDDDGVAVLGVPLMHNTDRFRWQEVILVEQVLAHLFTVVILALQQRRESRVHLLCLLHFEVSAGAFDGLCEHFDLLLVAALDHNTTLSNGFDSVDAGPQTLHVHLENHLFGGLGRLRRRVGGVSILLLVHTKHVFWLYWRCARGHRRVGSLAVGVS